MLSARFSVRNDERLGIREEAGFVPCGGTEIFCVTYQPSTPPKAGIVISSSLFAELMKIYRTEVVAARAFAAHGYAVIRFHCRGTGHSGGLSEEATATTMVEDTTWAADYLTRQIGVENIVFCGTRWGGLIAALAGKTRPGAPLALWEPVVDGRTFFREAFRAQRMSTVVSGPQAIGSTSSLAELQQHGVADMMGYPVYRGLYETSINRRLNEAAQSPGRPVLLVQVSPNTNLKPEFSQLIIAFRHAGSNVEVVLIEREEGWTFVGNPVQSTQELIDATLRWLPGVVR